MKGFLAGKFKLKDMGAVSMFVGLSITRDRQKQEIYITHAHYDGEILDMYNLVSCNPTTVPMMPMSQLSKATPDEELTPAIKRLYQAIVGSLRFLMNCTRPDLAFSVNKLAQFASSHTEAHLQVAKYVLRYVRGTVGSKMRIGPGRSTGLMGYFDSS